MAISARQAQLQEQKASSKYFGLFGDSRRVLAPKTTSLSNIARSAAKAEISEMVDRYNDGLVGNEEMQAFLQRQLGNPSLNQTDISDIQDNIRDFDFRVRKDKLEAVFKLAPENSLEQVTAAQALANFYQNRSAQLSPGSPAQLTALENYGVWTQKVADINESVDRLDRKNQRYLKEQEVYQTASNSSDRAAAKAQMYSELAQSAMDDGDQTEANRLMALAQQEQTRYEELVTKENTANMTNSIKTYIAQENEKISAMPNGSLEQIQAKAELYASVAQAYADSGDQINFSRYIAMYNDAKQDFEKKSAGNATGSVKAEINNVLAELQQAESAYKYNKPLTKSDGTSGFVNGNELAAFKVDAYQNIISYLNQQIANGVSGLEDDVVRYQDKLDAANFEYEKRQRGEILDVMTPSGTVTTVDASDPTVRERYAQGENLQTIKDEQGKDTQTNVAPYYQLQQYKNPTGQQFTQAQLQQMYNESAAAGAQYGKVYQVKDEYGVPKFVAEQYIDVPTENGVERVWTQHDENGQIVGYISEKSQAMTGKAREDGSSYLPYIATAGLPQNIMTEEQFSNKLKAASNVPPTEVDATMVQPLKPEPQTQPKPVTEVIKQAPIDYGISKLPVQYQDPLANISKTIQTTSPISYVSSKINQPSYSAPTTPPSGGTYPTTIQQGGTTKIKQYDPAQGMTYQTLEQAQKNYQQPKQESLGTKILNVVKQSPFNFLKSLF